MYAPTLEIKQFLGKGEEGKKKVKELKDSMPEWIFFDKKIVESQYALLNPTKFLKSCGVKGIYTFCGFVQLESLTEIELYKILIKNLYKKSIYSQTIKNFIKKIMPYIHDFEACPFHIADEYYWIYSFNLNEKGTAILPKLELIAENYFEHLYFFEPYGYLLI